VERLAARDPKLAEAVAGSVPGADVEVFAAQSGDPSVRVGGVRLHSGYDPREEGRAWAAHHREIVAGAPCVAVVGFGFGYHVEALLDEGAKEVVVFEPRADLLAAACRARDLGGVLERVGIVTGEAPPPAGGPFEIVVHRPSAEASPGWFARLLPRLEAFRAVRKGLRIAVVGPIYGGSLPVAGYCVEALRALGHEAHFVDNAPLAPAFHAIETFAADPSHRDLLRARFVDFAGEATTARLCALKPDLVLAVAQAPLTEAVFAALSQRRVPVAYWFVEDFRLMTYWRRTAPLCRWFFTIQRGPFFEALRQEGVRRFAYLPAAASLTVHRPLALSAGERAAYGSDVSFVGAGYYNRRRFFEGLLDFDFRIWGDGWNLAEPCGARVQRGGARVDTEEIVRIYNATKVNLNLHSSTYHEGVDPRGDFVNPRTFEVASCGAFQLVDPRSELPALLVPGREVVCFESLPDARRKIAWYLARPEERAEVAARGRERVAREHTYRHRMETLLDFVAQDGYEPPRWEKGERAVPEDLVEEAGRDTELGRYLARFRGRRSLSLQDVVEAIRGGEGPLEPVERMILALHEMAR